MTRILKKIRDDDGTAIAELAAMIDFRNEPKQILISLSGVILGEQTFELKDYLQNLSFFPADRWVLDLGDLDVISQRGLFSLVKMSSVLKGRGQILEISNINLGLRATLQQLNLEKFFIFTKEPTRIDDVEIPFDMEAISLN